MGDFNFPGINWDNLDSDSHGEAFLKLSQDCFLYQHVTSPTRENNILDLVFSTDDNMIDDLEVCENVIDSDHRLVRWKLVVNSTFNVVNSC